LPETTRNYPENAPLSPRQERAALELAVGRSRADAAKWARVSVESVKRWHREVPAFPRRVHELRSELTSQALGRLIDAQVSAAETLGYLSRKSRSEMIRLSAARAILEMSTKLRESVEFEERLKKLEQRDEPQRSSVAA
jgi:hypothetical protein